MPSESVAGFLDRAQASRVLFPEQVEQLIRQPDIPQSDLASLCEYLQARGVLTGFQASALRDARGHELSYGGYPVIDQIGPCPGGVAYRALHPTLRTPLVLRRMRAEWLAPTDNAINYVARARMFGMTAHPNTIHLLDAGTYGDEVYAVIDQPADAADLETLTNEVGGAMPGFLAAEYGRAVASALRAAHERGGVHGDVRPGNMVVGPLAVKVGPDGKEKRRPAPDAVVRLAELGLVPIRPPAGVDPASLHPYLPPERLDSASMDPRGDIYSLGASLYFLLTGRSPFAADDPELAAKIRTTDPQPIGTLRPDLLPEFTSLIAQMMQKDPTRRAMTAYDVEAGLIPFCRRGAAPSQPVSVPMAVPASAVAIAHAIPHAEEVPIPEAEEVIEAEPEAQPADMWGVDGNAFDMSHVDSDPTPRRRKQQEEPTSGKAWLMIILGGLLHLTAIAMLVLWLTGAFESTPKKSDSDENGSPGNRQGDRTPVRKSGNQ